MAKYDKSVDWFEMYVDDKRSMLNTMVRNLAADLDAGYDWFGASSVRQRERIDEYKAEYDGALERFKGMSEEQVQRWCFYDMLKRGAID